MENNKEAITIQDVKECIAFDRTQGVGKVLNSMVDIWYQQKINEGEEVAVNYAMDKLGEEMLKFKV